MDGRVRSCGTFDGLQTSPIWRSAAGAGESSACFWWRAAEVLHSWEVFRLGDGPNAKISPAPCMKKAFFARLITGLRRLSSLSSDCSLCCCIVCSHKVLSHVLSYLHVFLLSIRKMFSSHILTRCLCFYKLLLLLLFFSSTICFNYLMSTSHSIKRSDFLPSWQMLAPGF